ncbi:MAG: hypothetical protein ACI9XO_003959 [Paraglaciecola sp.]|jgi:hypothetical protein
MFDGSVELFVVFGISAIWEFAGRIGFFKTWIEDDVLTKKNLSENSEIKSVVVFISR